MRQSLKYFVFVPNKRSIRTSSRRGVSCALSHSVKCVPCRDRSVAQIAHAFEGAARCLEGFRRLAAAPKAFGTPRQVPASVEYLRRHAELGRHSNPAKQCRIQLHVAVDAGRVN